MKPRALLFDLFGTLLDVTGIARECDAVYPGHGEVLSRLWRDRQLKYSWLRSQMGRYADFEVVTDDALRASCGELGLDLRVGLSADLQHAFERLHAFPEVVSALEVMAADGLQLGVLSNGTNRQLAAAISGAGIDLPMQVLSADDVKVFKPDPRVYAHGVRASNRSLSEVAFVSSNWWDVAGAYAFGLASVWVNRTGSPPEELGATGAVEVHDLVDLLERLRHWDA